MKFGENLQKLRKRKGLSQEQLAEELGVTRQSVSKWESGQSVPDMEKLATICRIFSCDLDALVNGDVDQKVEHTSKNAFLSVMQDIGRNIAKTVHLFEKKSASQIIKMIAQMILIIIIIALLKIPFNMIEELVFNLFNPITNAGTQIVSSLWSFVINLIYAILAIITFFYVFKVKFLDDQPDIVHVPSTKEVIVEGQKIVTKKTLYTTKANNSFLEFLTTLIIWFLKFWLLLFVLPLIFATVSVIVVFVILIILIFKGVLLIGPILGCFAAILFAITLIEVIFDLLFNIKIREKRILISIISSFAIGGIGIALSIWYLASLTVINNTPPEFKKETIEKTIPMSESLLIQDHYRGVKYKVDDSLENNVKIEAVYLKKFNDVDIKLRNDYVYVHYSNSEYFSIKEVVNNIVKNLKKKQIYNYSDLNEYNITITASKENVEKLMKTQRDYYKSEDYYDYDDFQEEDEMDIDNMIEID